MFEDNNIMQLLSKWQPMDVEDALELLGSKYKVSSKIRSYAVSRLQIATNKVTIKFAINKKPLILKRNNQWRISFCNYYNWCKRCAMKISRKIAA